MRRSIAIVCAFLSAALVTAPTASAGTTGDDHPNAAAAGVDEVAQATKFRTALGFDASVGTVRTAAVDRTAFPDLTFGVPLTTAEAAEVLRDFFRARR